MGDACSVCGPRKCYGWRSDRGTRQKRGYDQAWLDLRERFICEQQEQAARQGYPWVTCGICGEQIRGQIDVDHIVEFKGLDDSLRLDEANLRCVHSRCHARKHAANRRGGGGSNTGA